MTQVIFLDFDGVLSNFIQAQVVISSSWRDGMTKSQLNELFKEYAHRVVGKTISQQGMSRQAEIMAYVKQHNVTCYIALDDDCRNTLFAPNCDFLFKTNYFTGLTIEKLPALIQFMQQRGFTEF